MKEKIDQLAKGFMTYELPNITLSEEKLNMEVEVGKVMDTSVTISNEADIHMKGLVYSSNPKVNVVNSQFVGSENVITISVDAVYQTVGDKLAGELTFVSNCGEITLPYIFTVTSPVLMSITGRIVNMVQFAALARENFAEAVRLFTSEEFVYFLRYYEEKNVFLRERLLKSNSEALALEQFLIATRKKMAVSVEAEKEEIVYDSCESAFQDSLKIIKNNWGYISLNITSDGNFIGIEQSSINSEDFVGNEYIIKYVVYPERMSQGLNECTINITGSGLSVSIPVRATLPNPDKAGMEDRLYSKRLVAKGMDNFIAYSLNQIPTGRYVSEAGAIIDKYVSTPGADTLFARLYRASLLRISGKESPAQAIINGVTDEELEASSPLTYAYYLYLCAAKVNTTKPEYMDKLYNLYSQFPKEHMIAIYSIQLDERYERNLRLRLDEYRALYNKGCKSPILFMEAAKVLLAEPLLLKDLGEFELSVIMFSLKHGFCNRDMASQFTSIVLRQRIYNKMCYNILAAVYDKFQLKDTLTAICQLLIKGYRKESRYFKWYLAGARENVRISDLYEYYMYSIDRDVEEDLDQSVLMYYVYNSKLSDKKLSYLYANIILHKDSNPIVYENYKEKVRLFALQQMREGHNDAQLAIIYNDCLSDEKKKEQYYEYLYKVLFKTEISCTNASMRYVCVAHRELGDEVMVPLINGKAIVDIYTTDAFIMFVDSAGERYVLPEDVTVTRFLNDDSLLAEAYRCNRDKLPLIIALGGRTRAQRKYDQISIDLRKQVIALADATPETKEAYLSELALYFYDHAQDEISEEDIKKLDIKQLSAVRRGKLIGLLILREQYAQAFKYIDECGFAEVDIKILEKFATSVSQNILNQYNKTLCDLMYYLFLNGRRHERILLYLVNFYNGATSDVYSIWQEAVIAQCANSELDERLMGQILFTESYLPYAEQVYTHYHRRARNRMLTKAYFNFLAYKYLISDIALTSTGLENMKKDAYFESNDIVLLAILKHYANKPELTTEEKEFAENKLETLCSKGKILPCFTSFSKYFRLPETMEDKVYIEYRSNPDHRIMIHIAHRQDGKRIVNEEPMRNVCYGIFIKELVLFSQETIEYVISDEYDGIMTGTEKQTLTGKSTLGNKSKSRYSRINAIIDARNQRDKSKSIELLNEYVKNEFAISQLFHEI